MRNHSTRLFKQVWRLELPLSIVREVEPATALFLKQTTWIAAHSGFVHTLERQVPGSALQQTSQMIPQSIQGCAMATQQIPKRYWTTFLQSFSRKHTGWLVRLETRSPGATSETQAREIALTSITLEPKPPDGAEIAIMLSGAGGLTHWVEQPEIIELEENQNGADHVLTIRSTDGLSTLLRFGATALPERVSRVAI